MYVVLFNDGVYITVNNQDEVLDVLRKAESNGWNISEECEVINLNGIVFNGDDDVWCSGSHFYYY